MSEAPKSFQSAGRSSPSPIQIEIESRPETANIRGFTRGSRRTYRVRPALRREVRIPRCVRRPDEAGGGRRRRGDSAAEPSAPGRKGRADLLRRTRCAPRRAARSRWASSAGSSAPGRSAPLVGPPAVSHSPPAATPPPSSPLRRSASSLRRLRALGQDPTSCSWPRAQLANPAQNPRLPPIPRTHTAAVHRPRSRIVRCERPSRCLFPPAPFLLVKVGSPREPVPPMASPRCPLPEALIGVASLLPAHRLCPASLCALLFFLNSRDLSLRV